MNESLDVILPRMLHDRWCVEAGERLLSRLITDGSLTGQVAAAVLDLDGSGAVRARGLAAKIRLVEQFQQLVRDTVPPEAILVDHGSRDEIHIVLPDAGPAEITSLCAQIRSAVGQYAFQIDGPHDTVRVTTSAGCAVLHGPQSGGEIFERTGDALNVAKQTRDCVRFIGAPPPRVRVKTRCEESAVRTVESSGPGIRQVLRAGIWALQEKHGPAWHYVGTVAGATQGRIPPIPPLLPSDLVPPGAVAFFELLVWSAAMEAALSSRAEQGGYRPVINSHHGSAAPEGYDLAARYLPGEWVACRDAGPAGTPLRPADVPDALQRARHEGPNRAVEIEAEVGPSLLAVIDSVSVARGRSRAQLLRESLRLGLDWVRAWQACDALS